MRAAILISVPLLFFHTALFADLNSKAAQRVSREQPAARTLYEISTEIDPKNRKYSGHQKVTFLNKGKQSANYLLFFIYPNDPSIAGTTKKYFQVSNVKVNGASARTEEKGPFLRVYLNDILRPQKKAVIDFDFAASLPPARATKDLFTEAMDELLRILKMESSEQQQDYGVFGSNKDILNLGLWYAALAKFEDAGWDEEEYSGIGDVSYFDPSDFDVQIRVPANYKVVTTGTITKRLPSSDGKIQLYTQSKMTRDFEVELSAKFEERTRLQNRVTIRSFFLPQHAESGQRVLDSAVQALEYFESKFGPYPYTELDVVEAPLYGGAGGVEFPGIVTISSMLYRDLTPDVQDDLLKKLIADNPTFDQLLEFVVAHEVAHQWWNAVVGSNSKQFPFIDEAMANYSAILYFEHYYGRQAAENQMALQMKVNYQLHRLLGGSDQPVQQPASSFKGALEYSAIVYGKGALYFDRLRSLIGDPAFFAAIKNYYNAYWFRIAGPDDFKAMVQKQAPRKRMQIEDLHHRWMKDRYGDEDIGPGTLDAIFKTVLGAQSEVQPADLDKLLKSLDDLLKQ